MEDTKPEETNVEEQKVSNVIFEENEIKTAAVSQISACPLYNVNSTLYRL